MIKKLRRKIVLYTIISVFSLLAVILSAINVTNFILVANDADNITERIQNNEGQLGGPGGMPGENGPGSKDFFESIRYFTYSEETNSLVQFKMSNMQEGEAIALAKRLINGASKGWTKVYYRYRVYTKEDVRYVTVIDQER